MDGRLRYVAGEALLLRPRVRPRLGGAACLRLPGHPRGLGVEGLGVLLAAAALVVDFSVDLSSLLKSLVRCRS